MAVGQREQVVAHQNDVGDFQGHVGTGGAHGDADVGGGQRGGVVDPVADHRNDLVALAEPSDDGHLLIGQHVGVHVVGADLIGDSVGHAGIVARQDDDPTDAESLQGRQRVRGARARLVGRGDDAPGGVGLDDDHQRRLALAAEPRRGLGDPGRHYHVMRRERGPRGRRRPSGRRPGRAPPCRRGAWKSSMESSIGRLDASAGGLGENRRGQMVLAAPLDGRREAEQDLRRQAVQGPDVGDFRRAGGDRAGLVEGDDVEPAKRFQVRPPLDQHAQSAARAIAESTTAGPPMTTAQGEADDQQDHGVVERVAAPSARRK